MTLDAWIVGRQGRPERALVPVADGEDGVPGVVRLGRAGRDREGRHPRREAVLRRQARIARTRSSATRAPSSSSPAAGWSTRGRRLRTRTSTPRVRDSNVADAARRRHARLRDAAAVNATRELLPHLPNGHQVVLSELGHSELVLDRAAEGEHAAPEHVLRHRQGRHLALHAAEGRLHAGGDAHRARQGLRRHDVGLPADRRSSRCC